VQETFDAWVSGITDAIMMAHESTEDAQIMLSQGNLYDSNINRSPTSYLLNPQSEIDQYPEGVVHLLCLFELIFYTNWI
jgi:neutral ceramidase